MSKSVQITIWVIVAIIVIGGIWLWLSGNNNEANPAAQSNTANNQTATVSDNNTSLDQDLANLDVQLNGLASDSASINDGLNDQPIAQ